MDCTRIVCELQRRGDALTVSRTITHYAYFPTEEDRAQFCLAITAEGFRIASLGRTTKGDLPHSVVFTSRSQVDLRTMVPVIRLLSEKAQRSGGEYDGWETAIVKPGPLST